MIKISRETKFFMLLRASLFGPIPLTILQVQKTIELPEIFALLS
jgi:hypothetical protein